MTVATPIQIEILRNAFNTIANEMSIALFKGAHTPIIYEAKDCSVGLYDAHGGLLGQAPGLPIFLGGLEACIRITRDHFGDDGLHEGDVILMNDSYLQGSHLTDITVLAPIHWQGHLVGFSATRADGGHLGGKDLGVSSDTTHIYEEGLRIPPVKLVKRDVLDEEIMSIVALNSYFHEARRGDLSAQIAACFKGRERLVELYEAYGSEVIRAASEDIFRQSRELDRLAVERIPDGVYRAEGVIDNDGVGDAPVPVRVTVRVDGAHMTVDLTGSSGPTRGPINSGTVQAVSAARLAFKEVVGPHRPVTGGNFQNLTVTVPEVSIFNAQEPSPCQWYYTPLGLMIDLILEALSPAIPDRVAAAHFGDSMIVSFHQEKSDASDGFAYIAAELGGWGAFQGGDGQDCMINVINGDFKTLPVEFVEAKFPISILEWSIRQDSGGAGRFRGGNGSRKVFRIDADDVHFSCWLDRTQTPAWGLLGGGSAVPSRAVLNEGTERERTFNKVTNMALERGDVLTLYTGGGGGFGDPVDRDRALVERDLELGYISPEYARAHHGW